MMSYIASISLLIVSFTVYIVLHNNHGPSPPGPRANIMGKIIKRKPPPPPPHHWDIFYAWWKQFGPVVFSDLGRRPIMILNTPKAAEDLLEKRSEYYSDRPRSIVGQEILSQNMRGLGLNYGERWRRWRKIQHSGLSGKVARTYQRFQTLESVIFLDEMIENPENYVNNMKRYAASVAISISYTRRVRTLEDQVVKGNYKALDNFSRTLIPGKEYLVESWPILLRLPKFMQWFRWEMDKLREMDTKLYVDCLRDVKQRMVKGLPQECIASRMLSESNLLETSEVELAYAAAASFAAGIDSTLATVEIFILITLHHGKSAKKAQDEIDSVVGRLRMPSFEDEKLLPYTNAFIKEVLRFLPPGATGIPHAVAKDDVYEGYFIPKGTIIYANINAIVKDEELFPNPGEFRPERFLNTTDPKLTDFSFPFGFGRRICPGIQIAQQTLFIIISRLLWAFDILPETDQNGKIILPNLSAFNGTLVRHPNPFKCRFVQRSPDVSTIIRTEVVDAARELKAWD